MLAAAQHALRNLGDEAGATAVWSEYANSTILVLTGAKHRVVVKAGHQWTASAVDRLVDNSKRVALGLQSDDLKAVATVPEIVGGCDNPPAICMKYVEGEDGADIIARLMTRHWSRHRLELLDLVRRWGRALAAYHKATQAELVQADRDDSEGFLGKVSRMFRISPSALAAHSGRDLLTLSLVDVGLHNVRVMESGTFCLLDLPAIRLGRLVHYDIAAALAWLDDAYRDAPLHARHVLRAELSEALVWGYAEVGEKSVLSHDGRWWIRFCQSWSQLAWVRTALQRRHGAQALANVGRASRGLLFLHRQRVTPRASHLRNSGRRDLR